MNSIRLNVKLITFILLSVLFLLYFILKLRSTDEYLSKSNSMKCPNYKDHCFNIYKKLRYPDPSMIIQPPPRKIPKELFEEFTQYGDMPIRSLWYFNEAYNESSSPHDESSLIPIIKNTELEFWIKKFRDGLPMQYNNVKLGKLLFENQDKIKDKSIVVIGTQAIWIESMLFDLNASKITTIEYNRKTYENEKLEWIHANDLLDEVIKNQKTELYDNAISFSSIEHSGLGRYGDPINPNGDLECIKQIHCLLKPNGYFFLGLPTNIVGDDILNNGYIDYNAHRVYGKLRLDLMFQGWKLITSYINDEYDIQTNVVFVLQKKAGLC